MFIVQPLNLLYLKTSSDVDITGDKTVFITWFKLGVEGRSESLSMGVLAGGRFQGVH